VIAPTQGLRARAQRLLVRFSGTEP
jgi:hypothetical protein